VAVVIYQELPHYTRNNWNALRRINLEHFGYFSVFFEELGKVFFAHMVLDFLNGLLIDINIRDLIFVPLARALIFNLIKEVNDNVLHALSFGHRLEQIAKRLNTFSL
jgi:hypothetical protein